MLIRSLRISAFQHSLPLFILRAGALVINTETRQPYVQLTAPRVSASLDEKLEVTTDIASLDKKDAKVQSVLWTAQNNVICFVAAFVSIE